MKHVSFLPFVALAVLVSVAACLAGGVPPGGAGGINERVLMETAEWAGDVAGCGYGYSLAGSEVVEGVAILLNVKSAPHPCQDVLGPGDVLVGGGVYWWLGGGVLQTVGGAEYGLPDWEVEGVLAVDPGGISVQCSSGFFACCFCNDNTPVARCRRNACGDNDCQGGGAGATSCSITQKACQ